MRIFLESIRLAATIHQKIRRRECLTDIINKGVKSTFVKDILEIRVFVFNFKSLPEDIMGDIISALTEKLLDRNNNKDLINDNLNFLSREFPFASGIIIQNLLTKAEKSGDQWYLSNAIEFLRYISLKKKYPVREIIHAGNTIARQSHSSKVLVNLVPFIEKNCENQESARIYIQFLQIMLLTGDLDDAVKLFRKITYPTEILPQYCNCLAKLIEECIFHDQKSAQFKAIFGKTDPTIFSDALYLAVHQISHATPFEDIVKHCDSLKQILALYSGCDALVLDSITTLINRGFLDSWDSSILVDLAKSIQDQSIREEAISTVVMKLAAIGVRTGNRDFLQQAVGITCLIEGQTNPVCNAKQHN